jgi:hypothetical protein
MPDSIDDERFKVQRLLDNYDRQLQDFIAGSSVTKPQFPDWNNFTPRVLLPGNISGNVTPKPIRSRMRSVRVINSYRPVA